MKKAPATVAAFTAFSLMCAPVAGADEPEARDHAPNTDDCPHQLLPPEATTTSEALIDGEFAPPPLPVAVAGNCGVSAAEGFNVPEEVLASAFLVADLDTGEIIAAKDPHGRYRPASVIKVLLALVAIDELPLDKQVVVSHGSAAQEGSAVGLGEGGTYSVEQLLYGLLLASGNDAAHALAQELGGDEAALAKVNELAAQLGTTDTRVMTYSGLDAAGMSSSAFDLGLMYRAAFANPTFARMVNTEFVDFPGYDDLEGYQVWNDNGLFMNDPEGLGGKTGYTDDAQHTFVGAAGRDGRRLMAVLLDTTIDKARPWEQARLLIDEAKSVPAGSGIGALVPVGDDNDTATELPQVSSIPAQTRNIGIISTIGVVTALIAVATMSARRRRR